MLTNFNLFLKDIKRLNLIVGDCFFVPNIGRVKANEAPEGLINSFKKINLIDIIPTQENYLRDLQADAINEIMLLNKTQLQNCLNRLKSFNTFSGFYKFWGSFYVKFVNNEYDNRDLLDLRLTLEGYFSVDYPENAQIHFDFIHDLQDEIFLKHGCLNGLIYQINEILNPKSDDIEGLIKPNNLNDAGVKTESSATIYPTMGAKTVVTLLGILRGYFESDRHSELKTVLETGNNPSNKLIFKGNANKLTDAFKQLYESNLITGCQKQDLVKWIANSFQCINKGIVKDLNIATTERSISGNDYNCKNPIIRVVNGEIIRA